MAVELSPESIEAIARWIVRLMQDQSPVKLGLTAADFYTPNQIAKSRGVTVTKVLTWINSGELKAVNYATKRGGLPRWKVSAQALEDFEKLRTAIPPSPKPARRRTPPPVHDYIGEFMAKRRN